MEYIGMVDQILAAEHSAKALAEEERRRREQVQSGLEGEIGALRENYLQQARRRVELVEQTEQAAAREQIAQLEERQKTAAARMEEWLFRRAYSGFSTRITPSLSRRYSNASFL